MAGCTNLNDRLFGGAVVLQIADGCATDTPTTSDWKGLAAGTSKGFDFNPNAVTSDADDMGGYVESIITNADFTLSFDGEVRKADDPALYGIGKFIKAFGDAIAAKTQPAYWVKMQYGPVTFTAYMVVTGLSSDGGTNDIVTFSTEFKVADGNTVTIESTATSTSPHSAPKY